MQWKVGYVLYHSNIYMYKSCLLVPVIKAVIFVDVDAEWAPLQTVSCLLVSLWQTVWQYKRSLARGNFKTLADLCADLL